jgi:curli biogenesis system outer membrane secretion channel CsgG
MRIRIAALLLLPVLLTGYCSSTSRWEGPRQTIAVPVILNTTKIKFSDNYINGLTDQYIASLIETGRFKVVERNRIEEILREHRMAMTGLLKTNNAIKIGQMVQAPYIVITTISSIEISRKRMDTIGYKQVEAEIKAVMTARIIDTKTGVAVAAARVEDDEDETKSRITTVGTQMGEEGDINNFDRTVKTLLEELSDKLARRLYRQRFQ